MPGEGNKDITANFWAWELSSSVSGGPGAQAVDGGTPEPGGEGVMESIPGRELGTMASQILPRDWFTTGIQALNPKTEDLTLSWRTLP